MRKEIEELVNEITPETKIADLIGRVETDEEITFLLQNVKSQPKSDELSDDLNLRALKELKGIPIKELTIPKIQKIMLIDFPKAEAVRDWLIRENITWDLNVECENGESKGTPTFDGEFVVLEFTVIDRVKDKRTRKEKNENKPIVLEVAAIKISSFKINEYYHTFVGVDGCDVDDIDFDDATFSIMPEYFIGAPSFKEVVEKLYAFIGNATIVIYPDRKQPYAFFQFTKQAKECGYIFENKVLRLWDIVEAVVLEEQICDNEINFNETNVLGKAELLQNCNTYYNDFQDVLISYNVEFDPFEELVFERNRNDPLSWAIAEAEVLVAILKSFNG